MRSVRDGSLPAGTSSSIPHSAFRIPHLLPPVLIYHRIGGPLELGVTRVGQAVFTRQMRALARDGWQTLSLTSYAANPPAKSFLLTFDDGYVSLVHTAFPVLAELGFTATTFLITDHVGGQNDWDVRYTWRRLSHLDWPAIEQWQARGFSFGSHGASHRRLTWLEPGAVAEDLGRSRRMLVQRLGAEAGSALAYPFGAANAGVRTAAREAGFTLGFAGPGGSGRDPFDLPRTPVYLWDIGDRPLGLRRDALGRAGQMAAYLANRCAVGTSWMLKLRG
jgi:peptidoglycan/xylan/chitin deacetylase (PgdA/CDA1 family)